MNNIQKQRINSITSSKVLFDETLAKHTTFGIGGPAECMVFPSNRQELKTLLKYAYKANIPVIFIGSGSNLLICDKGFTGIVISLKKSFKNIKITSKSIIVAESGVMLGTMVKQAMSNHITGFESLIGVPGTLGGALIMNAGAFGNEISKSFQEAKMMSITGEIKSYKRNEINFSYRHSTFPKNEILIEATFKCKKGSINKIHNDKNNASKNRKLNQPLKFRSAGSIFKNPTKELAAGYLIEKAGLKGYEYGGASISSKHANFIINLGEAKSSDVIYLIKLIKKNVAEKFKINLELEIKLIGFSEKINDEKYYD
jgi:UDP-N-acetylmuramate dehydrogenase